MRERLKFLFDRKFLGVMLPLAFPIALQNLLMCSFRLVDTLMIGRLGDTSIAAVGLAGQVSFFVELVVFGMASGSAVFLAQYHGAGNREGIWRTFGAMLLFAIPVGVLFTFGVMLFPSEVMSLLTNEESLILEGAKYIRYACVSYAGLSLYQALAVTLRSTENVRLPMATSIVAAITNAVLNYVFIFGKLGLPEMGVAGAGLATAVSSLINPLLMVIISVKQRNILYAPIKRLFDLAGFLGTYWKKVTPVLFNEMLWSLSIVCINMVFGRMGADNYAALTVFRTIENIVFVFFVGICNACNILVGKQVGAGNYAGAKLYAKRFLMLVPVFGACLGALIILLRGPVLGLFDISETARHTARALLLIYAIEVSFRNVPYIAVVGVFRAGGDTKVGLFVDCFTQYALSVPTVILCGLVFKLPFIVTYIILFVVEDTAKCLIVLTHYAKMKWIKPVTGAAGAKNALPEGPVMDV